MMIEENYSPVPDGPHLMKNMTVSASSKDIVI
jgi:hypothetical protein